MVQETSSSANAVKGTIRIPSLDLRIRLSDGGAQLLSSRPNGVPLIASTNRKSFTNRFYETADPDARDKKSSRKNKFIKIMEMLDIVGDADTSNPRLWKVGLASNFEFDKFFVMPYPHRQHESAAKSSARRCLRR